MTDSHFWPMPAAQGAPLCTAVVAHAPEDFVVEELPSWQPDGAGEHDVLWVEKRAANTRWVAAQLAAYAQCAERDVSFAGLKDRHAITRQWFSVHRPGRVIDWSAFEHGDIRILDAQAHSRKLRIGTLAGNRFDLLLRDTQCDAAQLAERIEALSHRGMPNYFGGQRFGIDGGNVEMARRFAQGRRLPRAKRSFALSAARAAIFNSLLRRRVADDSWDKPECGDVLMLEGSQSIFVVAADADMLDLQQRARAADVHPTGVLCGRGQTQATQRPAAMESEVVASLPLLTAACEKGGTNQQRRALRVIPRELKANIDGATVRLQFELPAGSYATVLINELFTVAEC